MGSKNDAAELTDEEMIAYSGSLLSLASADGRMDKTEIDIVFDLMATQNCSTSAQYEIRSFLVKPPDLSDCLAQLSDADEKVKFGLMIAMIELSWADEVFDPLEQEMLDTTQIHFGITTEQRLAMERWVKAIKEVEARGEDDDIATEALKGAAAGLTGVGVPIAAVYFSGSVVGLSAAGITSGLAALGLGFGMVSGIGTAIVLGVGLYLGVRKVLNISRNRKQQMRRQHEERRAQLVVGNLQKAINELIDRVHSLEEKASVGDANREALEKLTERLRTLRHTVEKRKMTLVRA